MKERLDNALAQAIRESGCRSIALVRRDGLVVAHRLAPGRDPRITAATAASITGSAEVAAEQLGQGEVADIIIRCTEGRIVAIGAGPSAILIALALPDVNLGLVLLGLSRAVKDIVSLLGTSEDLLRPST